METKRLLFRKMNFDDFDSLKKILSDSETMKYYPAPYDDSGVCRWINWCLACYEKRGFGLFAVVLKETDEFIGDCGITLQNINGNEVFEIGYHINKKYWNKGYCTEAYKEIIRFLFEEVNVKKIVASHLKINPASGKVMIKVGMKYCGEKVIYHKGSSQSKKSMTIRGTVL